MKILYEYQVMLSQKYGGVSRCFCELAVHLKRKYKENVKVVAWGESKIGYKNLKVMKMVMEQYEDISLVCLGGGKLESGELRHLSKYKSRILQMGVMFFIFYKKALEFPLWKQ